MNARSSIPQVARHAAAGDHERRSACRRPTSGSRRWDRSHQQRRQAWRDMAPEHCCKSHRDGLQQAGARRRHRLDGPAGDDRCASADQQPGVLRPDGERVRFHVEPVVREGNFAGRTRAISPSCPRAVPARLLLRCRSPPAASRALSALRVPTSSASPSHHRVLLFLADGEHPAGGAERAGRLQPRPPRTKLGDAYVSTWRSSCSRSRRAGRAGRVRRCLARAYTVMGAGTARPTPMARARSCRMRSSGP